MESVMDRPRVRSFEPGEAEKPPPSTAALAAARCNTGPRCLKADPQAAIGASCPASTACMMEWPQTRYRAARANPADADVECPAPSPPRCIVPHKPGLRPPKPL